MPEGVTHWHYVRFLPNAFLTFSRDTQWNEKKPREIRIYGQIWACEAWDGGSHTRTWHGGGLGLHARMASALPLTQLALDQPPSSSQPERTIAKSQLIAPCSRDYSVLKLKDKRTGTKCQYLLGQSKRSCPKLPQYPCGFRQISFPFNSALLHKDWCFTVMVANS